MRQQSMKLFCVVENFTELLNQYWMASRLAAQETCSLLVIEVEIGVTEMTPENMAFLTRQAGTDN